jgi:hypothetical protein
MNDDFAILLLFFGISITANVGLLVAWLGSKRRLRRLEERVLNVGSPRDSDDRDERAARLEQVVEGLTVQIEQIASAQEFLSRVITNRLERPGAAHPPVPKVVTPR